MKQRVGFPAGAGESTHSAARGVIWLLLTLILFAIVFLPILTR